MAERAEPVVNRISLAVAGGGLMHALAMLAACVAMPLLVGRALMLPPADVARLVDATVLVCGLGTLLQAFGASTFAGIRQPVMTGAAFAALGPLLAIAGDTGLGTAAERLQIIAGATMIAAALAIVLAPVSDRLLLIFPPVVRGAAMLMVGLVLLRSGVGWIAAPQEPGLLELAAPHKLAIAAAVLVAIVAVTRYAGGFAGLAVPLAIALGATVAWAALAISLAHLQAAPWVALPQLLPFGRPRFDVVPVLALTVGMLVAMIEASVLFRTLSADARSGSVDADCARGLTADGLASAVASVLAGMPCTAQPASSATSGSNGSGAADRMACAAAGLVLVLLGLSPKFGALLESVPQFVLGGAALVIFGNVTANGVKILADVDYQSQRQNLFIVALSVGIGLVPLVAPQFFKVVLAQQPFLTPLLQSSVLLSVITAVALNLFFNGVGRAAAGAEARTA